MALSKSHRPQDNPVYEFTSERMELTLHLTDDYIARNQMLNHLQREAHNWFELALGRAPVELHATLQVSIVSQESFAKYLN